MTEREQRCLAQLQPYTPYQGQNFEHHAYGPLENLYAEGRRNYLDQKRMAAHSADREYHPSGLSIGKAVLVPATEEPPKTVKWSPSQIQQKINRIIAASCAVTGVRPEEFLSRRRFRAITKARQLYCYFARERTKLSLHSIAGRCQLDHSTVLHSIRKVARERAEHQALIDAMARMIDHA